MNKSLLVAILIVSIIPALFTVGKGLNRLTGRAVFDENTKEVCQLNSDCKQPDVCCLFNGKNAGACSSESRCTLIGELTKNKNIALEKPATVYGTTTIAIFIGVTIFLLFVSISYLVLLYRKDDSNKIHPDKNTRSVLKDLKFAKISHEQTELYIIATVALIAIIAMVILALR